MTIRNQIMNTSEQQEIEEAKEAAIEVLLNMLTDHIMAFPGQQDGISGTIYQGSYVFYFRNSSLRK